MLVKALTWSFDSLPLPGQALPIPSCVCTPVSEFLCDIGIRLETL